MMKASGASKASSKAAAARKPMVTIQHKSKNGGEGITKSPSIDNHKSSSKARSVKPQQEGKMHRRNSSSGAGTSSNNNNKSQYKIEAVPGKRLHIAFHHHGTVLHGPLIGQRKQQVKEFLMDIWTQFGRVAETYIHKDLEYVYVTFRTHEQAVFALHGLSDTIQVQAAILDAIGGDEDRAHLAKQLFVEAGDDDNLFTATWSLTGK